MPRRRVQTAAVPAALAEIDAGHSPSPQVLRDAVRALLATLADRAPGRSVEIRVPPYGAVQCGEGPVHTRGTPPNVVETDPLTFVLLATGRLTWSQARAAGQIVASGVRSDLSAYLPCWPS